jgi:hypothetical protein
MQSSFNQSGKFWWRSNTLDTIPLDYIRWINIREYDLLVSLTHCEFRLKLAAIIQAVDIMEPPQNSNSETEAFAAH